PVTVVHTTAIHRRLHFCNNFFRLQRFAKPITGESLNFSAFSAYFGEAVRAVLRRQLIVERMCCEYQCDTVNLAQRYTTAVKRELLPARTVYFVMLNIFIGA